MRAVVIGVLAVLAVARGVGQQAVTPQPQQAQPQQPPAQSTDTPSQQPPTATKPPVKSNQLDPNGKVSDIPDPTVDPTKDPKTDPTKDPAKDSDKVIGDAGDAATGADAAGGGVDAPDYTGPAILSRGFALSRPLNPVNEPFRYYAGVSATYDSGLLGAFVQNGVVTSTAAAGADFNWGASMRKYRKKSILDFNYGGHFFEYFGHTKYSSQDHSLSAGYTYQFSPRFTVGVRETAGLYSNTYSVLNSTAISDVSNTSGTIVVAPNTESFDDRTYYFTTSGMATYQMTPRLSFSVNGAYFVVNRNSVDLANTKGYQTGADIAYRLTRRQTVGVFYSHSEFSYTKIFGDSNADSIGINYSISISPTLDLSASVGASRFDSQAIDTVIPNPLVQAVLGITVGVQKDYFVGYAPDFAFALTRKLKTSSLGASFSEGITPGNGLILTSKSQTEGVFWNLPTFRKYAMQVGAGHSNLSGYANGNGTAGSYGSYYARFSVSRPVTPLISSYLNLDFRDYGFGGGSTFHQTEYVVGIGFRFSPGQGAIKFW